MNRFLKIAFVSYLAISVFQSKGQSLDTTLRFNCAGTVKIITETKKKKVRWCKKNYQLRSEIHLSITNGRILNQTRNMVLTGYLKKGQAPKLIGLSIDGSFVLYENDLYFLKFPLDGTTAMFMQKQDLPLGVMGTSNLWQPLFEADGQIL